MNFSMKNLSRSNILKLVQAARTCPKFCIFGIENLIKIDKNFEKMSFIWFFLFGSGLCDMLDRLEKDYNLAKLDV